MNTGGKAPREQRLLKMMYHVPVFYSSTDEVSEI